MMFYNFKLNKFLITSFLVVALAGFADSVYLTTKYYIGTINCSVFSGCQEVLSSSYSDIFGIPTALLGAFFYLFILINILVYIQYKNKIATNVLAFIPTLGLLFSIWLVYLQLVVINAICIYCMGSALTSTLLFILSIFVLKTKNNKQE